MRRRDVALAGVPGMVVMAFLGPLIAAGYPIARALVVGDEPDVDGLVLVATLGWIPGLVAAVVLGVLPLLLAIQLWPDAEAELGPKRAIDSVSLVVVVTVIIELLVPVCLLARPLTGAFALLLTYGVVAGLVSRTALRLAWSSLPPWVEDSRSGERS